MHMKTMASFILIKKKVNVALFYSILLMEFMGVIVNNGKFHIFSIY